MAPEAKAEAKVDGKACRQAFLVHRAGPLAAHLTRAK